MRLTIIGCSGSFPGPDSPASCYLLAAEGFRLLLDLGNGALGALQRHAALDSIDAVCLSHLHADHCLDLCSYMVARTYHPDGPRPRLPVYAPAGTGHRMAQAYGFDEHPGMAGAFDFITLAPGTLTIGPFEVTVAHVNHPVETFGFRVEHAGRILAYSADTGESAALVGLASQADLLLCEASFLARPGLPTGLHLTARQAAEYAAQAGAAELLLTHLVPWNDPARTLAEAGESSFGGPISLAAPGHSVDLDWDAQPPA
ncbi:MAG TPA: MBL fold metallo-hydrolase [Streptosporangiaceae bacterium]|nr:MBL fold metallo-hydrolase [Streptosporangiaceae bacterium]